MLADKEKMTQVLFNLLSNANKFSPLNSTVTVQAVNNYDKVVVTVRDEAAPISEEDKANLFEYYYRSNDAKKREHFSGLGLGLAISKKIMDLHQGQIWLKESTPQGNIFAFSLPAIASTENSVVPSSASVEERQV